MAAKRHEHVLPKTATTVLCVVIVQLRRSIWKRRDFSTSLSIESSIEV
eukprot:gene4364-4785_t